MAFSLIHKMAAFEIQTRGHMTPPPPKGVGTQQMFMLRSSFLRSNPLPFYIPFFSRKRYPFCIPSIDNLLTNGTPFTYLV